MSRLLAFVLSFFVAFSAFAGKADVGIKGVISNPLADSVIITYITYNENWLDFDKKVIVEQLDKKGRFVASVPVSTDITLLTIQNGEQATELYVMPGDKLSLTVDAEDFDATLKYEGIGMKATAANFMAKHVLMGGFCNSIHQEVQNLMSKEQEEFITELKSLIQKELDFLIDNSAGLPQSFIRYWDATYEYTKFLKELEYPFMHEVVINKSYNVTVPEESYEIYEHVPAKFDDKYLPIDAYRLYLSRYYSAQLDAAGVKNTDGMYEKDDKMLELARVNMTPGSAEYTFAYYLFHATKGQPIERVESLFHTFKNRYENSSYTKMLQDKINTRKKLMAGAPAIDFEVVNADGKKMKLSDLKGKVVYLDFWASWCGPCIREFSYAKKVKEHFAGKDVVFAYVSIDEDDDACEKAKVKYELHGVHTRVSGWGAKLAKEYGINSVPSYFLIDREGNFAVDTAPRPSNTEELIKTIEGLL